MYYRDLTAYRYCEPNPLKRFIFRDINVGWLDEKHDFTTGTMDARLMERLLFLCTQRRVNVMRSWHRCEFCNEYPIKICNGDLEYCLGDAEIRVPRGIFRSFASPNLIYHYVAAHKYLPPPQFIRSLDRMTF